MSTSTPQLALSIDWESILPILLFVGYGISQMIGSGKKGDADAEDDPDAAEAEERARKVREEIRRAIEQRRRQLTGEPQADEAGAAEPVGQRRVYDPTLPEQAQRRVLTHPSRREASEPSDPEPPFVGGHDPISGGGESMLQAQLDAQRLRLEAAKAERAAAQERAQQIRSEANARQQARDARNQRRGSRHSNLAYDWESRDLDISVIGEQLRSPGGLRQAIIFHEILGKPVGERVD